MNRRRLIAAGMFAGVCLLSVTMAEAHRLDEYLQATRLSVERDRIVVEIDLTPGVAVAQEVFEAIDTNHDGRISSTESDAYAQLVVNSIVLSVDSKSVPVTLMERQFPERDEMASGAGTIRLRGTAPLVATPAGRHQLYYRNTHRSAISAYLVNALVSQDRQIDIDQQLRDYQQHELTIGYRVIPSWPSNLLWPLIVLAAFLAATHFRARIRQVPSRATATSL